MRRHVGGGDEGQAAAVPEDGEPGGARAIWRRSSRGGEQGAPSEYCSDGGGDAGRGGGEDGGDRGSGGDEGSGADGVAAGGGVVREGFGTGVEGAVDRSKSLAGARDGELR